uniref:Sterile alpha motif domain-containing protein 5 n=1 Tax=Eptatretus burgeri TaxID=7764 RepID=A0A8C4Q4C4_EPTBU
MSSQVVAEWLKALRLGQYTEAFLDNGYDDLEVCKQIGNADLDAIGVVPTQHRGEITAAVSRLCQERGTELYFTLEPVSPMPCPRTAVHEFPGSGPCPCPCALGLVRKSAPGMRTEERNRGVPTTLIGHFPEPTWRREKVTFPKLRLKVMIREKLQRDGIDLGKSPYSNKLLYFSPPRVGQLDGSVFYYQVILAWSKPFLTSSFTTSLCFLS